MQPPKKETVTKVATAVLSTTAKAKAREKKKAAAEGESPDSVCCTQTVINSKTEHRGYYRKTPMSR